jgi:hypothetical protein
MNRFLSLFIIFGVMGLLINNVGANSLIATVAPSGGLIKQYDATPPGIGIQEFNFNESGYGGNVHSFLITITCKSPSFSNLCNGRGGSMSRITQYPFDGSYFDFNTSQLNVVSYMANATVSDYNCGDPAAAVLAGSVSGCSLVPGSYAAGSTGWILMAYGGVTTTSTTTVSTTSTTPTTSVNPNVPPNGGSYILPNDLNNSHNNTARVPPACIKGTCVGLNSTKGVSPLTNPESFQNITIAGITIDIPFLNLPGNATIQRWLQLYYGSWIGNGALLFPIWLVATVITGVAAFLLYYEASVKFAQLYTYPFAYCIFSIVIYLLMGAYL